MNPYIGWTLAAAMVAAGQWIYGWQGAVAAITFVAFWLLLQFSRAMRVLRHAGRRPVGRVPSAVMLHTRLSAGMSLLQVINLTHCLGRHVSDSPEVWAWADAANDEVQLTLNTQGRISRWQLVRAAAQAPEPTEAPGSAP